MIVFASVNNHVISQQEREIENLNIEKARLEDITNFIFKSNKVMKEGDIKIS